MQKQFKAAFCFFMLWSCAQCYAQDYRFINFTQRDGLPNTQVQCLLQDKKGYIWIGTQDGLFRYDGYSFKAFYHNERDSFSIARSSIICLYEDKLGLLWAGTSKGASCYNPATSRFTNYEFDTADATKIGWRAKAIIEDRSGNLWFGTGQYPVCRFNRESNSFTRFGPKYNYANGLAIGNDGILYLGCNDGLWKFDTQKNELTREEKEPHIIQTLYSEGDRIFAGYYYRDKIGCYDVSAKTYHEQSYANVSQHIMAFATKSDEELWVATGDKGLGVYNKKTGACSFIKHRDSPYSIMEGKGALCLLKDRSGTLWIGHNEGLSKLDPRDQLFTWHTSIKPAADRNLYFNKFTKDPLTGNIFILADGGAGIYVIGNQDSFSIIPNITVDINGNPKAVHDICFDSEGELWMVDWEYVYKYERSRKQFRIIPNPKDRRTEKNPIFTSIYEDRKGKLWVGTLYKGLHKYDPLTLKTESYYHTARKDFTLTDYLKTAGEDKKGNIWFYSHYGFCFCNPETDKFTCFKRTLWDKDKTDCRAMALDNNGNAWMGTYEDGLLLYEPSSGKFSRFTTSEGLCNDEISDIAKDKNGFLWIGTGDGLSRLDPATKTFTNYTVSEGLSNGPISGLGIIGDTLYIGFRDLYCTTTISSLDKNSFVPPLVINSFKVFDREFTLPAGEDPEDIQLSYKQNHFSFEFAALNYTAPGKNQYAYKLEGFDKDWIYAGNRHYASYTYVPGGKYIFRVKASNNDGVWNETGISIPLEIIPPFWETWWFRILMAILIPSLIFYFVNRRIRFIKKREKEKLLLQQQLSGLKMKALRAQMNPHFIFNALNSIQQQIISNDTDNAFIYLDKFARLLRKILDNSEQGLVSLQDELLSLSLYIEIESLRFQHSFHYKIDIDSSVKQDSIFIPGMLLQPYVENAIWHGLLTKEGERNIYIYVSIENKMMHCIIEDNGIGREKAMEQPRKHSHSSKGMLITGERLNVIGKIENRNANVNITDLKDENGKGTGTRVELVIPIIEEHEKNLAWTY